VTIGFSRRTLLHGVGQLVTDENICLPLIYFIVSRTITIVSKYNQPQDGVLQLHQSARVVSIFFFFFFFFTDSRYENNKLIIYNFINSILSLSKAHFLMSLKSDLTMSDSCLSKQNDEGLKVDCICFIYILCTLFMYLTVHIIIQWNRIKHLFIDLIVPCILGRVVVELGPVVFWL
jgi:hypothetical protein